MSLKKKEKREEKHQYDMENISVCRQVPTFKISQYNIDSFEVHLTRNSLS
jgi:hypothetical protein